MASERGGRRWLIWRGIVLILSCFTGLCTIFAAVVTAVQGWHEHVQARWPAAMARIEKCAVDIYRDGHQRDWYYVDCQIRYTAGIEEIATHAKSRHIPSPSRVVSPDPWASWREMQTWVDKHPQGTSIPVHYDPANHEKALLLETDMLRSGPNAPDNLRVLEAFAVLCAVLLAVATIIGRLGNKSADRVIP